MQPQPRIVTRAVVTMMPSPPKKPLEQIQGQGHIDRFTRPNIVPNTNDGDELANTPPLLRRRIIPDDDDDADDRPMVGNQATANGTTADTVIIPDTENESDTNFGVVLLPVRQPTQDQSQQSSRSRQTKSRRTASPELDQIAEQVRPLH